MVAHRGVSGLEQENTHAAFVAAGNRSYFGIETDLHKTVDGGYVTIHDDSTGRVGTEAMTVEEAFFEVLRGLPLKEKDGSCRCDLRLPSLEEYLSICKRYEKEAVLELKNPMEREAVHGIVAECARLYGLEHVTFIAFCFQNLLYVKEAAPEAKAQYLLAEEIKPEHIQKMVENRIDLDTHYLALSQELVETLHKAGLVINCWTVDDPEIAEKLVSWGVDQITSNILE
jgi:glycerophosphoryl diester phosphodiesterase